MKAQEIELDIKYPDKIIALPSFTENGYHLYSTDAISCLKFLRKEIDIQFYVSPDGYWEQRSIDWLGPTLFFTGKLLLENPDLLNILFECISNYVKDKTPSREKTTVKMKVVCKKDETSKCLEIDYEGDITGIIDIKETIISLIKD
ncbi:hypothetical protein ACEV6Q_00960 [Enterobacter ludwigii]|uniref:hypothetical protein n=1 Tax=Enterobacter ludwigii TaxID=299767 RepID=UPI003BEF4445